MFNCHANSHKHHTEGSCEYGWKLLPVCNHNSCDHKHYNSGDIMFLISCVSSCEYMFKKLCEFMGGSLSWRVTTLPCLVTIGLV